MNANILVLLLFSRINNVDAFFKNTLQDKRILVVDDSSVIRGIIAKALEQREAKVELAEDGLAAIEKHKSFQPDLTIMDINMPRLSGLDSILRIRAFDAQAKFIILSSSSKKDEVVTAKTLNALAYVVKPFRMNDFLDTIAKAVECPPKHQ